METLNTLKYANRARNIKNKEQSMKFFVEIFFYKIVLRGTCFFKGFNIKSIYNLYQSAGVLKLYRLAIEMFSM